LLGAVAVLLGYYSWAGFELSRVVFERFFTASVAGFMVGAFAGLRARDEFLREDWTGHRPLVGLLTGALVGGVSGLLVCDACAGSAAAIGGALGGFSDALVYSHVLEEFD